MPLTPPLLDSRTFKDLLDEARARLPRYTPEWTNFNDSDPGMALVQLHAWMTETILYELNRVPELNYLKFLDLLGITPEPAHPARTELSFTLKDPPQLTVNIPQLTRVGVDDPDAPSDLVFETDRTLRAIDAAIGAVIIPGGNAGGQSRTLITRFEDGKTEWAYNFNPFGTLGPESGTRTLYIGLHLRPGRETKAAQYSEDRFPAGPLDIFIDAVRVHDRAAGRDAPVIEGPVGTSCPPPGAAGQLPGHLGWYVFTGTGDEANLFDDASHDGWTRLSLSEDSSRALSGSGHLVFEMPASVTALDPARLSAEFWAQMEAIRPPRTRADLVELLTEHPEIAENLAELWEKMGATAAELDEIAACGEDVGRIIDVIEAIAPDADSPDADSLDPGKLSLADWIRADEGFATALPQNDDGYLPLYWLRAEVETVPGNAAPPATLRGLHLNTVPATQAMTRLQDQLGRSNGRPEQVFKLPKVPVLIDPASKLPNLELEIAEDGQRAEWQRVDDFHLSGPDDPHYMLNPQTGEIRLGDGRRGRIPVAGSAVTATRYRVGGGAVGNVAAGLISKLQGSLRHVRGVSNLRPGHDGSDAEPLDAVKARAPHDLRTRDRAVSAADFADLAMRTPGVALHRVFALPRRAVKDDALVEREGAVTLLVLPKLDQLMPQPDEDQKRAICRWLEPRRLITTELHVIGPRYAPITRLSAQLVVDRDHDLGAVTQAATEALLDFLSPFSGGEDGTGWPFGGHIYYSAVYQRLLAVPGLRRATHLDVVIDGVPGDTRADIAEIQPDQLPALARNAVDLVASYG